MVVEDLEAEVVEGLAQVAVMDTGLVKEAAMVVALVGITESSPKGYNFMFKLIKSRIK